MPTMTGSGIIIPDLRSTSDLRQFCRAVDDRCSREATAWENAALICASNWDALAINRSRFGASPGTRATRHLRYMVGLQRQICKASDFLWQDYNRLVYIPWRQSQAPTRFDPSK